jgi:osmotically-inducible protein OsmY
MGITPVQDKTITRQVQDRIAGRGLKSPCRIEVQTSKGQVTLTGSVQYLQQKACAVSAASAISGVRHVIDRLIVKTVPKF